MPQSKWENDPKIKLKDFVVNLNLVQKSLKYNQQEKKKISNQAKFNEFYNQKDPRFD